MDTFDAIYQRRAVKKFDPQHVIPEDDIRRMMDAAIQSPTSFNLQHWRFVLVRDKELRKKIRKAAYGQPQVTDASLLIIMTADTKAWAKEPSRYWRNAPDEVRDKVVNSIGPSHEGNDQLQRDEAMRSCGLAGQTIMLAAKAMGYDSCPMVGFEAKRVAELIKLPHDHVISFLIAIGKGSKPPGPKPGQLALDEVVVYETFD